MLFSGCTQGGPSGGPADGQVLEDGAGSIRGVVTDDQLIPLAGVRVALNEADARTTDEGGAFAFENVQPGRHVISIAHAGFHAHAQTIEVALGQVVDVAILLVPEGVPLPYHTTWHQTGLIGCSFDSFVPLSYLANCEVFFILGLHEIDDYIRIFDVGNLENSSGWWSETTWTAAQTFARSLKILWCGTIVGTVPEQNTWVVNCFNEAQGASPVRNRIPKEQLLDYLEGTPSEHCDPKTNPEQCLLVSLAYTGQDGFHQSGYGMGLVLQQRFEQYLTMFFNADLPVEFSILPDQ